MRAQKLFCRKDNIAVPLLIHCWDQEDEPMNGECRIVDAGPELREYIGDDPQDVWHHILRAGYRITEVKHEG